MKKLLGFSKLRNFIKNAREKQQQNEETRQCYSCNFFM